jgi:hypothetical protein
LKYAPDAGFGCQARGIGFGLLDTKRRSSVQVLPAGGSIDVRGSACANANNVPNVWIMPGRIVFIGTSS